MVVVVVVVGVVVMRVVVVVFRVADEGDGEVVGARVR